MRIRLPVIPAIFLVISATLIGPAAWAADTVIITNNTPASATSTDSAAVQLVVPDGQLRNHAFRVFVTHPISTAMSPRLRLLMSHSWQNELTGEELSLTPEFVAANQRETHEINGVKVELTGTLLLFDIGAYPVNRFMPMSRLDPILEWHESTTTNAATISAVGDTVYVGNMISAAVVTLILVAIIVAALCLLSRQAKGSSVYLLVGLDGGLSLWRAQTAAWTVAIGAMVLFYGLIRREVPEIPTTLVMLMGMSAVTSGLSHYQAQKKVGQSGTDATSTSPNDAAGSPPPAQPTLSTNPPAASAKARHQPRLMDLITDGNVVSIPRAQLVFWTCLTLGLFVSKTVLEGDLWDVPAQLVGLMGISQASYLTPKFLDKTTPQPDAPAS